MDAENHRAQADADLRRRESRAVEMRHGIAHVSEQGSELRGAKALDRRGVAQQPLVAHSEDLADHPAAS